MEFPERISNRITEGIGKTLPDLSKQQLEVVAYGLAILITNIYKILFILILSYFLGILKPMLITFFSYGFLRTYASGVHAKTELACLLTTNPIMFGIVYTSIYIPIGLPIKLSFFVITFILFLKYAPADTAERPLISLVLRKRLKRLSCLALLLECAIALFFSQTSFSTIITLAAFIQGLMLTPTAYKLFKADYQMGLKMT